MTQAQYDQLSNPQHQAFLDLVAARSPENLSGDGEHSPELQARMMRDLQRQWHQLETQIGFAVTEHEVMAREIREEQTPTAPALARSRRRP
jgi:hypothetical protein